MIGAILLAMSWLLLRLEGRGLAAIGVDRPGRRAREFTLGFLFLGGVSAVQQLGLSLAAGDSLMWARAFVATGSVAAPIGLHLGWNLVAYLVFSAGPPGAGLLVPTSGALPLVAGGPASLALNVLLPLAATVLVLWHLRRARPE